MSPMSKGEIMLGTAICVAILGFATLFVVTWVKTGPLAPEQPPTIIYKALNCKGYPSSAENLATCQAK